MSLSPAHFLYIQTSGHRRPELIQDPDKIHAELGSASGVVGSVAGKLFLSPKILITDTELNRRLFFDKVWRQPDIPRDSKDMLDTTKHL